MRVRERRFESPLAEGIERFLAHKRALGRRFDSEERALRLFDRYLVARQVGSVHEIDPPLVEGFLLSRRRPRPRSHNHLAGVLSRLFDWLVGNGDLDESPARAPLRREAADRIPFLFSPSQARRLLEHAAQLKDHPRAPLRGSTYRTIFALLYGLGLRVGEACRLRLEDVDWRRDLLIIRRTKFSKSRLTPFGPRMARTLRRHLRLREARHGAAPPQAPLFSFDGERPVHTNKVSENFQALVPLLQLKIPPGVRPPSPHCLRHSFAVSTLLRWYRTGVDPSSRLLHLSTFLGHANPKSTAVYLTVTAELLQEASRRYERFAGAAIEEAQP